MWSLAIPVLNLALGVPSRVPLSALGFFNSNWRLSPEGVLCDGINGRPGPAALGGLWTFPELILSLRTRNEREPLSQRPPVTFLFFLNVGQGMTVALKMSLVFSLVVEKERTLGLSSSIHKH